MEDEIVDDAFLQIEKFESTWISGKVKTYMPEGFIKDNVRLSNIRKKSQTTVLVLVMVIAVLVLILA